jgi:hypothetical protein
MRFAHNAYSATPRAFAMERADCAVRALSVALGVSYARAHNALARSGRKQRRGTKVKLLWRALNIFGIGFTATAFRRDIPGLADYTASTGCRVKHSGIPTLAQWLATHRTGHFVILRKGHFFAVVDGTIHDWSHSKTSARSRVLDIIEVQPTEIKHEHATDGDRAGVQRLHQQDEAQEKDASLAGAVYADARERNARADRTQDAQGGSATMNAKQFCAWQKKMGWSNPQAAKELRMSVRQLINYRTGAAPISAQFALLCELVAIIAKRGKR